VKKSYTKEILVSSEDIDELDHVNNVRYIQWIQDISTEHWFYASKNKLSKKYIWVVASHFVEYKHSAVLNDKLLIETYVEKFVGSLSHRIVTIKNSVNGQTIVKAVTKWCLIDPETKRPMRIPAEILNLDL
jgi:acyl-CoA thioester hydrolase